MGLLRKATAVTYLSLASVAATYNTAVAADPAHDVDPCSNAEVTGYASSVTESCFAYTSPVEGEQEQVRPLGVSSPVHAGEQIDCTAQGTVTITFCASHADRVIRGGTGQRFSVPNVPGRTKEDFTSPALRRAVVPHALEATVASVDPSAFPTCDRVIGTLAVSDPNPSWSPRALIESLARQSNCFRIVEVATLAQNQLERDLGVGAGQFVGADYLLVIDISAGADVETARVSLKLLDARSSEWLAMTEGRASWSSGVRPNSVDSSFRQGTNGVVAGAYPVPGNGQSGVANYAAAEGRESDAGSYAAAEIAEAVQSAYVESFSALVRQVKELAASGATYASCAPPAQVTTPKLSEEQTRIESVHIAGDTTIIAVAWPPLGAPRIAINAKLVLADGRAIDAELIFLHPYSGFTTLGLRGAPAALNLRVGSNCISVRYNNGPWVGYELVLSAAQFQQAQAAHEVTTPSDH